MREPDQVPPDALRRRLVAHARCPAGDAQPMTRSFPRLTVALQADDVHQSRKLAHAKVGQRASLQLVDRCTRQASDSREPLLRKAQRNSTFSYELTDLM